MRRALVYVLASAVAVGGALSADAAAAATKPVLTAIPAKQAPAGLDDPVWRDAPAVEIPMEGKERFAGKTLSVTAKAVHEGETIHMRFTWPDATHSVTKGAWQYDGTGWKRQGGDEDRLSLLFEISRIEGFASKGCAVACHVPAGKTAEEGKFGTKSDAEKGDLWHWKAARSAPYHSADDGWLTMYTEKATGRKNDKGKGGDKANETADKKMPMFMRDPVKKVSAPGFLLAEEAVAIKEPVSFKPGETITHRMPVMPEGSRGDIKAVSRYGDGGWTLMLSRKLNTGNDDDVAFDPRREYNFAVAVFDDSGDEDSYDSEVAVLRFRR